LSIATVSLVLFSRDPVSHSPESLESLLLLAADIAPGPLSVVSARLTEPPLRRLETATRHGVDDSSLDGVEVYTAIELPASTSPTAEVVDALLGASTGYTHGWRFHQHELLALPDGLEDGWVARVAMARGLPGLTHEQFMNYWLHAHAPLVISQGPGFRGYRLHDPVVPTELVPWDGFVEQFYPNLEAWTQHDNAIFESKPAVRADLAKFLGAVQQYCAYDFRSLRT
jgi:hypothetical protein